jgi:polar amino acid transport system permease protein
MDTFTAWFLGLFSNWGIVWKNFDYLLIGAYPQGPLGGLAMSIVMAVIGIFGAFWIGLAVGLMRLSRRRWLSWPALVYIEIVRGTPLLMVIFWFYFFAPILLGRAVPETESAIAAFIVFTGAYVAEIVRAGVPGKSRKETEWSATRGRGCLIRRPWIHVILPQALRNMIPSFVNQFCVPYQGHLPCDDHQCQRADLVRSPHLHPDPRRRLRKSSWPSRCFTSSSAGG